jgi:hypothetical protein
LNRRASVTGFVGRSEVDATFGYRATLKVSAIGAVID